MSPGESPGCLGGSDGRSGFNPPRGGEPRGILKTLGIAGGKAVVSIRPGVVSPGEYGGEECIEFKDKSFNPPRGGEPRGMSPGGMGTVRADGVSIRPGVVSPGESSLKPQLMRLLASFNPPRGGEPRGIRHDPPEHCGGTESFNPPRGGEPRGILPR